VWVLWVLGGLLAWLTVGTLVAVVVGRSIRLADQRSTRELPNFVGEVGSRAPSASVATSGAAGVKRGRVPLPPVAVVLAALGVALETVGFVLRLSGAHGETAQRFSMDAPLSVPRMFVTALFAVAAVAALSAAGRFPGRRLWWLAVGVVAAAISFVKGGGTIHASAMAWLSRTVGSTGALLVSVAVAAAVVATLWFLSRAERRDRLRVLGSLGLYAVAAVGLSGVSAHVSGAWAATVATFLEESGEALGGVVFLLAVLVGVAPRLVLPTEWVLRRSADAHTLDAEGPVGVRPATGPR
jgi:hypothetical protein